ncbi:transcriptional regulator [Pokkaliibacter sp. MBI-7]|uniref:helix-turn-helix transcriptional regulator n=1 Tax=Pokkaliibacter sp. MBI-7 TaxID=3040600 RepID=UPI0024472B4F|nr:transcriptional regulator [Pokkaliibacter sp. MBI-7]MDH2434391.1 transcriptional regulator [Pokkaliibacter sp. MBI-7]
MSTDHALPPQASDEKIIYLLKTQGEMSAAELAERLLMTSMGARQHLQALEQQGLVTYTDRAEGRGRPRRCWFLTDAAWQRFPDRHAQLTVTLLDSISQLFGEAGLDQLISQRERDSEADYIRALAECTDLEARLQALAQRRSEEGYMAQWQAEQDGSYLLTEHHCPICAAASRCQQFCRSELELFRRLLAPARVERSQHLLSNGSRCIYRITP